MTARTRIRFKAEDDPPPPPWEPELERVSIQPPLRTPLDPPPPCFSTPSPVRIRSHDFPTFPIPLVLRTHGFYPRSVLDGHGIARADWIRFLEDLAIAARLSAQGRTTPTAMPFVPLLAHRVFPPRACSTVYGELCALVQLWNQCAFERRKVRVSLQVAEERSYVLVVESL